MAGPQGERCYVYGLVPAGRHLPPLFTLEHGGLGAIVSQEPPPDAMAHARVVEQACNLGACLPCSYGTQVPRDGLLAWMAANAERALGALDRLAGQVEFSFKVWGARRPSPGGGGGRRYLDGLRLQAAAQRDQAERCRQVAGAFLGALPAGVTEIREVDGGGLLYRAELLVPAELAERVQPVFEAVRPALGADLGARLSGPWPPYYFAGVMLSGRDRSPGAAGGEPSGAHGGPPAGA